MATHPTILAWEIPWTEEPGKLQPMGSQKGDTTQRLKNNSNLGQEFSYGGATEGQEWRLESDD